MPDWNEEKAKELSEETLQAISSILQKFEPSVVMKFVVLVETVDDAGQRGMWTCTSQGIVPWDVLGMLQWGIQMEQSKMICREGNA